MFSSVLIIELIFISNAICWVEEMENPGLYQGDMVLTPTQYEELRNGRNIFSSTSQKEKLWPNAIVPYEIQSDLRTESKAVSEINKAIEQYHKYTCIRFVKSTNQPGYVSFYKGGGCSSRVGYSASRNRISLSSGCWWRATIMHEIAHNLGFDHEQSRPDRDNYVKIIYSNIKRGMDFNFELLDSSKFDSLNTPYDYQSIMHYAWNAFAKDRKMRTIETLDPNQQYLIGQREGFSHTDIIQINKLYNCKGTYSTLPPYVQPPIGCYNSKSGAECAINAAKGFCNDRIWKTYMHSKCRLSCKLCGGGTMVTDAPVTVPPTTVKITTASSGDCRDRVIDCDKIGRSKCTVWVRYMSKSCRKYCGLC